VSFDYAYVKRTPDNDDRFKILFRTSSTSNTWKTLYSSSTNPSEINTVKEEGMTTNDGSIVYALNYEPSDEEWKTVKIENIAAFRNKNFVEMKIEYFGRDGNYFYFDNLTIGNDIALTTDEFDFENSIELFPNPSKGNVNLTFNLGSDTELDLEVVDILGKSYGNLAKGFQAGEHQVSISEITSKLTSGVYFVNITKDQKTSTQKFVISK
ncbi:MAG: T9SS type A sorting domain-containing protein, partial [Flavobacteriales bacterium]